MKPFPARAQISIQGMKEPSLSFSVEGAPENQEDWAILLSEMVEAIKAPVISNPEPL